MTDQEYVYWDDIRFPFVGQNIDTSTGRIDYDYTELGIAYQNNARFPNELVGMICQFHHSRKPGSNIRPHIHWLQSQAAIPNFMIEYRLYANGATPPGWTQAILSTHAFPYTAGTILQISSFPEVDGSALVEVSDFMDIKLYRDTANASGLFPGVDPVATAVTVKEFDNHYRISKQGSVSELANP